MGGGASKLRVATLKGHTNDVRAVASYTTRAGAARVVSGSDDDTVRSGTRTRSGSLQRGEGTLVA